MRTRAIGRSALATLGALGLVLGGVAVGTGGPVGAAGQVSPTTNADDGSAGSLRFILENLADATTTVVLPAGSGPYQLTNCGGSGGDININNDVTIEGNGNTIQQTCASASGGGVLVSNNNLTLRNLTITGGKTTNAGAGLDWTDGTKLTIDHVTFTGNVAGNDAGAVNVSPSSGTVTVANSTFSNNTSGDDGGAIDVNSANTTLAVNASTFNGNSAADQGGAVATENSPVSVTLVNSTVTANTTHGIGGALAILEDTNDNLTLVYDTITNNIVVVPAVAATTAEDHPVHAQQGPPPASLGVTGDFNVFGTVITGPVGGPNCDVVGANSVTSHDFNYSDDTTCGLTAAHDRAAAGNDPLLGALADNGGPTQTQLPQTGSPLINFIPVANCGDGNSLAGFAVTTDQRGITRPQSTGCEEGSVEILVAVAVTPRFTG